MAQLYLAVAGIPGNADSVNWLLKLNTPPPNLFARHEINLIRCVDEIEG
jgi:hypothetical protein